MHSPRTLPVRFLITGSPIWLWIVLAGIGADWGTSLTAEDQPLVQVRFLSAVAPPQPASRQLTIEGRILRKAQDGGLLIESRTGELWPIPATQNPELQILPEPYSPLTGEPLKNSLREQFGPDFEIVQTPHYVICTNAGTGYGEWCGQLFERLHGGFSRFWKDRLPEFSPPDQPLIAIAFATPEEFERFQIADAGGQVSGALGYYSAKTNRMVLYDHSYASGRATSAEEARKRSLVQLNSIATVVHEAAHQLSFNVGLQTRYADNPIWLSEGMAMYFETPDLEGRSGWKTIGHINPARLDSYREIEKSRPIDLRTLLATDDRFREPALAGEAYSEAWALHFYLLRTQKEKYIQYIQRIGSKPPLKRDTPEERIADFEAAFGSLEEVTTAQRKFMTRLRAGR